MNERATLSERATAGIIDHVIILICVGILLFMGLFSLSLGGFITAFFLSYLLWIIYFTIFEATSGQTIGKRMVSIKVVMRDGSRPGLIIILLRTLFRLVDSLPTLYIVGILVILISADDQRLGDIVAGTIVVDC